MAKNGPRGSSAARLSMTWHCCGQCGKDPRPTVWLVGPCRRESLRRNGTFDHQITCKGEQDVGSNTTNTCSALRATANSSTFSSKCAAAADARAGRSVRCCRGCHGHDHATALSALATCARQQKEKKRKRKKTIVTRASQVVPHPSTDRARPCLTSQIRRDAVRSQ